MPTQAPLQGLGALLHIAFKEIRLLGWDGKAEQAAQLADAVCQLPLRMYSEAFQWEHYERSLRTYQERYPKRSPEMDYVRFLKQIEVSGPVAPAEESAAKPLRPIGLAEGEFVVPDDFDAPLPEDILRHFEGCGRG